MKTLSADALRVALLLVSLSVAALAQGWKADESRHVSVASQGRTLQVRVDSTVALSDVVGALCGKQKMQCSGTESLAAFPVPSMTVSGTAEQVIFDLLQGTGVNYSILRTASGAISKLTVLGHAPAGTQNASGPAGVKNGSADAAQQIQSSEMTYSEPESAEESGRSERVMVMIFGGASNASTETGGSAANLLNAAGGTQAANSKVPEFLPFPDQFGNPIRTTPTAPPTVLPFPDHNGNPIPVTPVPVTGPPIPLKGQ